jgi:hypothetical protein
MTEAEKLEYRLTRLEACVDQDAETDTMLINRVLVLEKALDEVLGRLASQDAVDSLIVGSVNAALGL